MISDILLSWNELTVILAVWFSVVSLAVGADCGPEFLKERRAEARLKKAIESMAMAKAAEPPAFDPDVTFKLGVYKIEKEEPVKRRHARV